MTDELYIWLTLLIALLASILLLVVIYKLGRKFKNSQHDIYLYSFLTIFVLLITSFTYFHSKFLIMPTTGPSMLPNIKNTYYILARDYYLKNNINYGDVVIIEPSIKTKGLSLVKRVVGLSDDKVQIKNGYLYIKGRLNDTINVGGYKFHPNEVEFVLKKLPGIKDVVLKKIDDEFEIGFRLVAFLEIDPKFQMSESELIKHCRKNLESYKAPNEIKFVNKFPRSSTGKIKRGEIN